MKTTVTIKKKSSKMVDTKYGAKKKYNIQVLTSKNRELWVDGFANSVSDDWTEGQTVEMDIESREYNGKTYYGFKTPKLEQIILEKLENIERILMGNVPMPKAMVHQAEEEPLPEDEPIDDDLPF